MSDDERGYISKLELLLNLLNNQYPECIIAARIPAGVRIKKFNAFHKKIVGQYYFTWLNYPSHQSYWANWAQETDEYNRNNMFESEIFRHASDCAEIFWNHIGRDKMTEQLPSLKPGEQHKDRDFRASAEWIGTPISLFLFFFFFFS
jgi:hypothetical protein